MIKSNIRTKYIHQHNAIQCFIDNIYVADYTEQTKTAAIKKAVICFSPTSPSDIDFFSIINTPKVSIDGIEFNNSSFVCIHGRPKTQCEAVFFPTNSTAESWTLFCELKYSSQPLNNENNLRKAIKQLYKTRYYYIQNNVIGLTNSCYLIASLPLQAEPFTNFSVPPAMLMKLKRQKNIILRLKNSVEIINDKHISV